MKFLAFALILFCPSISKAQFADCMSPGYIGSFGVGGVTDLTCTQLFDFAFSTPGGERHVRGIADLNADWVARPGTAAAAEAAAREVVERLADLGTYRIGDVTILLLGDRLTPMESAGRHPRDVLAQAWVPTENRVGECRVTLFLWGAGGLAEGFPTTLAHEMFHCVQYATLSPDQMATYDANGEWWIEGSAESFAAYAIPDSTGTTAWANDFNTSVAVLKPIHDMATESVIFFHWLHGHIGIDGLMPFLAGMSGVGGDSGQRAAMRDALSDTEWLDFAKAYVDGTIAHPHGQPLALDGSFPVEFLHIDTSSRHSVQIKPFTLFPMMAEYACGRWENRATPAGANLASRVMGERDWQDGWLAEMDSRDGREPLMQTVALHTGDTSLQFALHARRTESCLNCQGATRIDRCMVGNWEGDMRPIVELMRRVGAPISRNQMGSMYLQVNEDGTFITSPVSVDFQATTVDQHGVSTYDVSGVAGASVGRWAIAGPGQLVGCAAQTEGGGETVLAQTPAGGWVAAMINGASGPSAGTVPYTCGPSRMTTRVVMGRWGEVEFPFTRLSAPETEE